MCHAGWKMAGSQSAAGSGSGEGMLVLGVDTCGPAGSVALARIDAAKTRILGQKELAGRTYSATLVANVGEVLQESGVTLHDVGAIVVVNGPGSFTGVRVGLSAVKGLAEPGRIGVVAVSRLEVLARKAGANSAALDAHRQEVFLRVEEREMLAGVEELAELQSSSEVSQVSNDGRLFEGLTPGFGATEVVAGPVGVCEDAAAGLLERVWPGVRLAQVCAPTAADAIELCLPRVLAGAFADLALLDGHYLRRSDAEIFGDVPKGIEVDSRRVRVRRMTAADVSRVTEIAASTQHAPGWPREAYEAALDTDRQPRRVALVAEEGSSGKLAGFVVVSVVAPEAELETIVTAVPHQRLGIAQVLFSTLKHQLRRQGVREVILEVRAGNAGAQGFYRFLGFVEEGRRPGYYAEPAEDAILMRLRLV